ncbi:MAG: asparagine synthase (glutamine-hydrolyzing) [Marinifilaceae bacterium]
MCGISGVFNFNGKRIDLSKLRSMNEMIRHRGPDDEGYLLFNTSAQTQTHFSGGDSCEQIKAHFPLLKEDMHANLGLAHRRLSIIDLSAKGHQPMSNLEGDLSIVFNGEIYNYLEIRKELIGKGYSFISGSDTEVVISAYREWGEACINKFNGMWSFALWDAKEQKLFCSRDRFGIKPFYYAITPDGIVFGSEAKQLLAFDIDKSLNEEVIYKSFSLGSFHVNSECTYWNGIKYLPASHSMIIKDGKISIKRYYDLEESSFEKSTLSYVDATERYKELFLDSVNLRMRSDVLVGSTLSGGLDSSAIVCAASKMTDKEYNTFTSYYDYNKVYDERKYADIVCDATGAKPHYLSTKVDDFLKEMEKITWHHDYPLMGSSPMSSYFVNKEAKKYNTTVLLDGQGTDELLGGYNHAYYRYYADLMKSRKVGRLYREFPDYLMNNDKGSLPSRLAKTLFILGNSELSAYNREAKYNLQFPLNISSSNYNFENNISNIASSKLSSFLYNNLYSTVLPSLLHFVDRNSMAHSIESRVPFLDYRLVEFAFSLPSDYKINGCFSKRIHRDAIKGLVPREIVERKDKIGFVSPGENIWLRGDLSSFVDDTINSQSFKERGIFDMPKIHSIWSSYKKGDNKNSNVLWKTLMLEQWFKVFKD